MIRTIIKLISFFCVSASAGTFVGNGGNASDVELYVSRMIIEKTLLKISEDKDAASKLCRCEGEYAQYPACKSLEKLNEEQVSFCGKFISDRAAALSNLLKSTVRIQWTDQVLLVKENGSTMPVDALAIYNDKTILINKENYLNLTSNERNFLLGHEIFHLTEWDKKPVTDEQKIGPMTESTGGRTLLNAVGAALVMYSIQNDIVDQYEGNLKRSRRDKKFWVSLDLGAFNAKEDLETLYIPKSYTGGTLGFKYLLSEYWMMGAHFSSYEAKDSFLGTINAKDKLFISGVGIFYRYFPFSNPFSFKGQSFGTLGVKYESLSGQFSLQEDVLSIEDKTSAQYLTLDAQYYIPLRAGFWLQAGLSYNKPNYSYSTSIDAQYSQDRFHFNLGASYAF